MIRNSFIWLLAAALLSGCACASRKTSEPAGGASATVAASGARPFVESGFLTDYSGLAPVSPGALRHTYRNPTTKFAGYDRILFDRITIWRDQEDTEPVESDDFQKVADDLYALIGAQVGRTFELADTAGPGVARMRIALVGIDELDDQLDVYITQAAPKATDNAELLPAGLREFGRKAWLEAEMLDSVSGTVLFSVVDRAADVIPHPEPLGTWHDLHVAFEAWAQIVAERLGALHAES